MRKVVSIVLASMVLFTAFSFSVFAAAPKKIDVAFVIDTTGSMGDDIDEVKSNMKDYLSYFDESGMDYQIAIIDYRDFSERTGRSYDYPYSVCLRFTNNKDEITDSISALSLGNGGDTNETVYSALVEGLDELSWRKTAGKVAILMGDAPALDPEPYTGYTSEIVIEKLRTGKIAQKTELLKSGADSLQSVESVNFSNDKEQFVSSNDNNLVVAKNDIVKANAKENSSTTDVDSYITLFALATSSSSVSCFENLCSATGGKVFSTYSSEDISNSIIEIIDMIPDVVDEPELTFWEKVAEFFKMIWYYISFQWAF